MSTMNYYRLQTLKPQRTTLKLLRKCSITLFYEKTPLHSCRSLRSFLWNASLIKRHENCRSSFTASPILKLAYSMWPEIMHISFLEFNPKICIFFFPFSTILRKTSLDYLVRRRCSPHEERWREIAATDASHRGKKLKKDCDCQYTFLPPHPSSLPAGTGWGWAATATF